MTPVEFSSSGSGLSFTTLYLVSAGGMGGLGEAEGAVTTSAIPS